MHESVLRCVAGDLESSELASGAAQLLVREAIERGRPSKAVARLCSTLMDAASGDAFHRGLVNALWQYFECRLKLRAEHFKQVAASASHVASLIG